MQHRTLKKNKRIYKPAKYPIYYIKQEFLRHKYDSKECAKTASKIRKIVDGSSLSEALSELFREDPHYLFLLWGNIFPITAKDLGEGNSYFYNSDNINAEIEWLLIQIKKNKEKLKYFVVCRDEIEKDILLGYYDSALERLNDLQNKCGVSIWYYEMKMLIYSYSGKEKDLIKLVGDVNIEKKDTKHGFVPLQLAYLSKRCSKTYSAFAYDAEIESSFKSHTDTQNDFNEYLLMKLNFYKYVKHENLSAALIFEATNSLIDRYITLSMVLKSSFTSIDTGLNGTSSSIEMNLCKTALSSYALKMYRQTEDIQLLPMVAYSCIHDVPERYWNKKLVEIFDAYYSGNFSMTIDKCREFIEKDQPYFDVVKIYCRSLIALGIGFKQITFYGECILDQISRNLYKSMSEINNVKYLNDLYQINKNIYGLAFACGLDYYINREHNEECDRTLKCISLYYFDPFYCKIFEDNQLKLDYLAAAEQHFNNSISINYRQLRITDRVYESDNVSKQILDVDKAKIAFKKGDYSNALNSWLILLNSYTKNLPIVRRAISFIYKCYENLNNKQAAITFYVDNYLKGKSYVSRINTVPLVNQLYKERYKEGVKNGLDLQLFVFLNDREDARKSSVLERFCAYKDVDKASDLVSELDAESNRKKVELYFYLLATEDILRHVVYVSSTTDVLDERQKIAQYLSTIETSENYELYCRLNQSILDEMIIYQNVAKTDERKIYVNSGLLFKYELKDQEGLYNQFKKQFAESGETNAYFVVSAVSSCDGKLGDSAVINTSVKFTSKPFIDAACQVFKMVRDAFLSSKFGLQTYLSTRIRHGVLEGVLRSGFDNLHLLLKTQNNKYMADKYWELNYPLQDNDQALLMKYLEKFSKGVADEIDWFKKNILQIKVKDDDKGMFNYVLSPDDMCYATVQAEISSNNYEEFCTSLIEYLFQMTNRCLVNIREEVNTTLKKNFTRLVDTLSSDISRFSGRPIGHGLVDAVNDARVDVNQKMAQIEKWFYLQDRTLEDFSLARQIRTVWDITSRMFPNIESKPDFEGEDNNIVIKADYYIHFSDIFTIFFNNMLSYSRPSHTRIFKIALHDIDNNGIILHFENHIIRDSENELNEKFRKMLNSSYSKLQEEGQSGLVKVKKIIKYDLRCEDNELNVTAENGKCIMDVKLNIKDIRA